MSVAELKRRRVHNFLLCKQSSDHAFVYIFDVEKRFLGLDLKYIEQMLGTFFYLCWKQNSS